MSRLYSGICHTDYAACTGTLGRAPPVPAGKSTSLSHEFSLHRIPGQIGGHEGTLDRNFECIVKLIFD